MDQDGSQDSPLSTAANVAGLLTFLFAVAATAYARIRYLRSSSTEYLHIKTSLSWYKTESTWLSYLVDAQQQPVAPPSQNDTAADGVGTERSSIGSMDDSEKGNAEWPRRRRTGLDKGTSTSTTSEAPTQRAEQQMFAFVMDDLLNLEHRLLEIIDDVESRADPTPTNSSSKPSDVGLSWSIIPGTWHGGRPSVAVAWLSVRTKALELVRQRAALTERVQFLQLSMISSRLRYLEGKVAAREAGLYEHNESVKAAIAAQAAEIRKLESRESTVADRSLKPG